MKHTKQRWLAALLALCLLLSLTAPAMAMQPDEAAEDVEAAALPAEKAPAEDTETGTGEESVPEEVVPEEGEASDIPETLAAGTEVTAERRSGYDVATIRYTDASGTEQAIAFRETENGYAYTLPQGVAESAVTVEYFSTTRWDGAVDISWYDADQTEFTLTTPAQLAGLAALVNGRASAETSRWRIKGDTALLVSTRKDNVILVGAGGGNVTGTVYYGSADYDFSNKTVYLGCDMDMGGSDGVNWTPIGGKYPMAPDDMDDPIPIEAFFNGTLDGRGHRVTNLYCDRYSAKHYAYSQAVGLVVYLSNATPAGSVFRYYSANGKNLLGDYYTVTADVTLSAVMESMVAGTVQLPESSVYTLTVTKTGTAYVDGEAVSVTDAPVVSGDPIYENDVLTVKAAVKDGVYPEDNDYVYSGKFDFVFAYQDGASSPETKRNLLSTKFTVARTDAPLVITAVPKTTEKTWLQVADTSWYSDSGTAFTITTARQLAGLAQLVNDKTDTFSGKTVRLGNDISLRNDDGTSGTRLWSGIGTSGSFNGTFDGVGHAITQMTASTSGSVALFVTCSGAVIRELSLFGEATGGRAAGLAVDMTNTTVENCAVSVKVTASNSGASASGGIAGTMNGGTMIGCVNRNAVTSENGVGGLAGELKGGGTIQDCANYGAVSGNNSNGGLGGMVGKVSSGTLLRCANYGAVSGTSWYTGGLAGYCSSGTVTDCYNTAAVTGGHGTYAKSYVGGLVGSAAVYTLSNCFTGGAVSVGGTYGTAGGVFGYDGTNSKSSGTNLWYLDSACTAASGSATNAAITACTAAQLESGAVWTAFNVNGCFTRGEQGYPELSTIPAAYAIRGRVDAGGRSVTVTLKESGQTVQTLTGIVDDFQLSLRANGSYSLLFEAEGCVSHQIVIPQDFTGLLDTVMLCRAGDVNMDGVLDVYDLQRLYEELSGLDPLTDDYARLLADANGDGPVTVADVQWLYEYLLAASGT